MRKTNKSVLGAIIKLSTVHFSEPPENAKFVQHIKMSVRHMLLMLFDIIIMILL